MAFSRIIVLMAIFLMYAYTFPAAALQCDMSDKQAITVGDSQGFILPPCMAGVNKNSQKWVWFAPLRLNDSLLNEQIIFNKLRRDGYAIAGIYTEEFYGSDWGEEIFSQFYTNLTSKHHFHTKPCLLARSRGGLELLRWANSNPEKVQCVAAVYPVTSIYSYPGLFIAVGEFGLIEGIKLLWDSSAYNPNDNYIHMTEHKIPVFMIHGDSDTLVPYVDNTAVFAERYARAGGDIDVILIKGQGHNVWNGYWDNEAMHAFMKMHLNGLP